MRLEVFWQFLLFADYGKRWHLVHLAIGLACSQPLRLLNNYQAEIMQQLTLRLLAFSSPAYFQQFF
jgi:hypothetical protein